MATQTVSADPTILASRTFLEKLFQAYGPRDFAVRFWDGSSLDADPGQTTRYTLALKHPGAVRRMFTPFNKIGLGEAYIYDDYDIEGDILAFVKLIRYLIARRQSMRRAERWQMLMRLLRLQKDAPERSGRQAADLQGRQRSLERDQAAISYHYDIPGSFFRLFLDSHLQYTCGYMHTPEDELETMQQQKLDHICRKLRLKPGERLIDFGCGWGNLVVFAAKHYGVHSTGVTLSQEQADWAHREIAEAGLEDRCQIHLCDYRNTPEAVSFDKAVSVGFIEHLGEKMMPVFFNKLWKLLRPGGLYLHHCITLRNFTPYPRWTAFARKYVFPDGEIRPLASSLHWAEKQGFEIRDVENLREHYIRTLEHWVHNLESNYAEAVRLTDEVNYRVFRIYMAGATEGFRNGTYQLNQTLFSKPDQGKTELPLTRADLYQGTMWPH